LRFGDEVARVFSRVRLIVRERMSGIVSGVYHEFSFYILLNVSEIHNLVTSHSVQLGGNVSCLH